MITFAFGWGFLILHFIKKQNIYILIKNKEKICMRMYLVPIKDAEEGKLILLLALTFFGMTAQFVVDRGPSNATFLMLPIAR
jgi:transposase-like protein